MNSDLILGIDGGGSKTIAALADRSGRILQLKSAGGVNPMDNPQWRANLRECIECFGDNSNLSAIAAALPAYGEVAELSRQQEEAIRQGFPKARTVVLNDVDAAHRGAFAGKPGILLLSGTGSMAWARNAFDQSARSGGFGDVIGDEGSSYWIGRRALSLISQSLDGRTPPTILTELVFSHLKLDLGDAMNSLAGWVTSLPSPRAGVASLSSLVDRAARDGDASALSLLDLAAVELAKHHGAVEAHCETNVGWSYAGGTFRSDVLLECLQHRIGKAPDIPKLPPIGGALLVAAQSSGWSLRDDWLERIASASYTAIKRLTTA